MAKTRQRAVSTQTSMLLLATNDTATPVWAASRKVASAATLAERLIAKLQIAHGPVAAIVTFGGKPSDAIVDFVGNLASLLHLRSAPQCGIKSTKAGLIAAFLWRNQEDLSELQTSAQQDPAYGPRLLPLTLLGQRWASAALLALKESGLARDEEIGQAVASVIRGERWTNVEDGGAAASETLEQVMGGIAARLPVDFTARREILLRLTDTFREQLAAALQAPLNARLATLPQESYEQKQALVLWLNSELRRFGLAVRCPKTGRASLLQVDIGRQPDKGRFQTDNVNENGKRERPLSFNELIPVDLMADDLSRASWGKWAGHSESSAERRPGRRHR